MKRRVAVVMGGTSEEREVSLKSGKAIAGALREFGHDVVEVDLSVENIEPVKAVAPEVAFIALHGRFGEDGGIQAMLADANIPYTGSAPQASRAGMNKMASKCFFITHDVPTSPFRLVTTTQQWNHIDNAIDEAGLPLVVKPLRQGSSVGVSIAKTKDEVATALSKAFKYGHHALIERHISGREFTVGILGDHALPLIELCPKREFFDWNAKYVDSGTQYIPQPGLPPEVYQNLQEISLAAHGALDCRHFSRVDLMLESDGSPYVLEVNTVPGFTERSLFPRAARQAGIAFPKVCDMIVEMALASIVEQSTGKRAADYSVPETTPRGP